MQSNIPSNERLLPTLKKLVRGYVSLLESARERIIFHGGTCDTVEQMENGDPYLAEARAAIALAESSPPETEVTLKRCPYCERPADDAGGINHVGGCAGLENAGLNRLQLYMILARGAQKAPAEPEKCEHLRSELLAEKRTNGEPLFEMRKCLDCTKIFRARRTLKTEG
jgi:hypothetical protein